MTTLLLKIHEFAIKRGLKIEIRIGETVMFDSPQAIEIKISKGLHHIGMLLYTDNLKENPNEDIVYNALERAADQLNNTT